MQFSGRRMSDERCNDQKCQLSRAADQQVQQQSVPDLLEAALQLYVDYLDLALSKQHKPVQLGLQLAAAARWAPRLQAQVARPRPRGWDGCALQAVLVPPSAAGDTTKATDPYFPFEDAVDVWGRTFAALGINYSGSVMTLDLCDRKV